MQQAMHVCVLLSFLLVVLLVYEGFFDGLLEALGLKWRSFTSSRRAPCALPVLLARQRPQTVQVPITCGPSGPSRSAPIIIRIMWNTPE